MFCLCWWWGWGDTEPYQCSCRSNTVVRSVAIFALCSILQVDLYFGKMDSAFVLAARAAAHEHSCKLTAAKLAAAMAAHHAAMLAGLDEASAALAGCQTTL